MIDLLRLLPSFWTQTRKTSSAWDRVLRRALDEGVAHVSAHEVTVGPFTVWVSNYPYAFGYNRADPLEQLPSVWTRIRLRRAIEQWQVEQYERQYPRA